MNKKKIAFVALPVLAAIMIAGASTVSAHGWFGGMMRGSVSAEQAAQHQAAMFEEQAGALGISGEQVKAGWAEGKNLKEIAEANGISEAEFESKMEAARTQRMTEHMNALVSQGIITQEQAEQRLQFMEQRHEQMQAGDGMRKRNGGHGGMMGMF